MKSKIGPMVLVVAFPLLLTGISISARRTQEPVIPQPLNWVAFEADFTQTQPGFPEIAGRYFRGSDASFRVEEHAADSSLDTTWISNVPRAVSYTYHSAVGRWFSRPLDVGPDGRVKILQRRTTTPGLMHVEERIEGFDLYEYQEPDGSVERQAPALNFFPLTRDSTQTGVRRVFSNIQLREPTRSLFDLPPGIVPELMKDKK